MRRKRKQKKIAIASAILAVLVIILIVLIVKDNKSDSKKTESKQTTETKALTEKTTGTLDKTEAVTQKATEVVNEKQTEAPTEAQTEAQTEAPNQNSGKETKVLGKTSKGFEIKQVDGVTYVDGVLIANKTYALPEDFVPQNPETPVVSGYSLTSLDVETMQNWRKLQAACSSQGLNIYISSGYRSYWTQENLYSNYVARDGKEAADTYSARAGHSEHQTGLCFDLNSIDDSFAATPEGQWVNDNCYKYGFIIRYPKGKEPQTGYMYESWHLRYVGNELAAKLYNGGNWITLEEYYGITSSYN